MPNQFDTREEWLNFITDEVRPLFKAVDAPLPKQVRMAVGFTSNGYRSKSIGECWSPKASADKYAEIFIKPDQDDAMRVAGILVHELCHAAVGVEHGHKAPFARVARALGLEGKMTATTESDTFRKMMAPILKKAGPLPHKRLNAMVTTKKKQATRLLKCECEECGYTVRTTKKWLEVGAPICPQDDVPMKCEDMGGDE